MIVWFVSSVLGESRKLKLTGYLLQVLASVPKNCRMGLAIFFFVNGVVVVFSAFPCTVVFSFKMKELFHFLCLTIVKQIIYLNCVVSSYNVIMCYLWVKLVLLYTARSIVDFEIKEKETSLTLNTSIC